MELQANKSQSKRQLSDGPNPQQPNAGPLRVVKKPIPNLTKPKTKSSEPPTTFIASTHLFPETCSTAHTGEISRLGFGADYCVV
jgi:hypothetical protein